MKEHIQATFDESQQRFGANKIAAVLADRGVRTSPKYVAELMREMGLQSVSIYSKRDYQKSEQRSPKRKVRGERFTVILRRGRTHGISAMWKDFRWERRRMATR